MLPEDEPPEGPNQDSPLHLRPHRPIETRCPRQHVHPGPDRRVLKVGRFGIPEVVHTDRGTAFHNELVSELLRMTGTEQSLSTAYSSGKNGIVERANQDVLERNPFRYSSP